MFWHLHLYVCIFGRPLRRMENRWRVTSLPWAFLKTTTARTTAGPWPGSSASFRLCTGSWRRYGWYFCCHTSHVWYHMLARRLKDHWSVAALAVLPWQRSDSSCCCTLLVLIQIMHDRTQTADRCFWSALYLLQCFPSLKKVQLPSLSKLPFKSIDQKFLDKSKNQLNTFLQVSHDVVARLLTVSMKEMSVDWNSVSRNVMLFPLELHIRAQQSLKLIPNSLHWVQFNYWNVPSGPKGKIFASYSHYIAECVLCGCSSVMMSHSKERAVKNKQTPWEIENSSVSSNWLAFDFPFNFFCHSKMFSIFLPGPTFKMNLSFPNLT